MKIHNIRLGFACNSSSTHSFILFPKDKPDPSSEECGHLTIDDFNSEAFMVVDRRKKLDYIGTFLSHSLCYKGLPKYIWEYYAREWLEMDNPREFVSRSLSGSDPIDLPIPVGGKLPCEEFFKEFKEWLLQENVILFGDNNNFTEAFRELSLKYEGKSLIGRLQHNNFTRCRKDPVTGYWLLFDKHTGNKLRIRFDDAPITYASIPELVDLKITDYCEQECEFCYANSTEKGRHAKTEDVITILRSLAQLGVPEVVLGGGEPTKHPDFKEIIKQAYKYDLSVNFTTKNYAWFTEENVKFLKKYVGRVAFSAQNAYSDAKKIQSIVHYHDISSFKYAVQMVDGVSDIEKILSCLESYYGVKYVLLGYKAVGRGANCDERTLKSIESKKLKNGSALSSLNQVNIGVDTKFLEDHREEIEALNIPELLYTPYEGHFSMAIDAVKMTMAPSSYAPESQHVRLVREGKRDSYSSWRYWVKPVYAKSIQQFFEKGSKNVYYDTLPLCSEEIDIELRGLIAKLNKWGYATKGCCQGSTSTCEADADGHAKYPYILFERPIPEKVVKFLRGDVTISEDQREIQYRSLVRDVSYFSTIVERAFSTFGTHNLNLEKNNES